MKKPLKYEILHTHPPTTFPEAESMDSDEVTALLPHTGKYDAAIRRIRGLTTGESLRFKFPKVVNVRKAIRGLVSAMYARGIKAPTGYGYYKQIGTDGSLIVSLKPRKPRA